MFIVAELGQAHEGSLGIAHSYIDALSNTGVDAVKFQTHIAEAESSEFEPFRVKFSYEDENRYDYWKRMEFTPSQWIGLRKHCDDVGLEFISSPFSVTAVALLEEVGVKRYKIGSGEVSNLLMLEKIARTGKPVILSSGMSSFSELNRACTLLKSFDISFSILQCTTAYPTKPEQWGLNVLAELRKEFKVPIGFSDHSGEIYACLSAVSLGATILEFHVVFDKQMFGPDAQASLTIEQVTSLVKGARNIEKSLANPIQKDMTEKYNALKIVFGKSLAVNKDLFKGHQIVFEDLESKKPAGYGISASDYREILGKRIIKDISAYSFLNREDIE